MMNRCSGFFAAWLWLVTSPLLPGQVLSPPMLWMAAGGAVGETAEWKFQALYRDHVIACSAGIQKPAFWGLMLAPPINVLAVGTGTGYSTVTLRIRVPADPRLVGSCIHLQAESITGPPAPFHGSVSNLATWVVAANPSPRFRVSTLDPQCSYFGPCRQQRSARAALRDGTLLFTGQKSVQPGPVPPIISPQTNDAELYDPVQNRTLNVGPMLNFRADHAVQPLADGSALVVGGDLLPPPMLCLAELYHPWQRRFIPACNIPILFTRPYTASMQDPATRREYVLIAEGAMNVARCDAVLYDATRRIAHRLPPPVHQRCGAATGSFPGGVLITGGTDLFSGQALDEVEIFLLGTRRFHTWGRLKRARTGHAMVAVDATHFLVIGGSSGGRAIADVELFDAATATSVVLPVRLHAPRENFAAVLRPDGSVLVAGGTDPAGSTPGRTPELLTAAGSTPLRQLRTLYGQVTALPLPGGRMIVFGLQTVHQFP